MQRERWQCKQRHWAKKHLFHECCGQFSNHRIITGQWVKRSKTNMACMGVIHQRHNMGFNCVNCSDTNRKSSAMTHLVVSSHCLLICWPVWSHCYLVLALFVFSINLSALHFDYKVFNITIKKIQYRIPTQWGSEAGSSDWKYCQSYPHVCLSMWYYPFQQKTLLQLYYKLKLIHPETLEAGGALDFFLLDQFPHLVGCTTPCELCQDNEGKGAVQDQGTEGGCGTWPSRIQ